MLTNLEREFMIKMIDRLCAFGLIDNLQSNAVCRWYSEAGLRKEGICMQSGATKACFHHKDLANWVVKVGYIKDVKINYAAKEFEIYQAATEKGLARYFPKTFYLGEFYGQPFYIQQRAYCEEGRVSSDWYEQLRASYEKNGEEYDSDCLWDDIDNLDDDEKLSLSFNNDELYEFLAEHNIGDFHAGNFGYIDEVLVIVDFAGYME